MERARVVGLLVALLAVTACGGEGGAATPRGESSGAAPAPVRNCDRETSLARAPERIVSLNQAATELLLALGVQDRMVGTAYLDNPVRDDLATAYADVPVLAEQYPSKEVLLAASPDLVVAGLASAFSRADGRDRDALEGLGVSTYAMQCNDDEDLTFTETLERVREVAALVGAEGRGRELVADLQRQWGTKAPAGPRVLVYYGGEDKPNVAGGRGIADEIVEQAGGVNVMDDVDSTYGELSWEQVVQRAPDVIVLADYDDPTVPDATERERFLTGFAPVRGVPAVQQRRFPVVPLTGLSFPSVRNAEVAAQLRTTLQEVAAR